MAAQSVLVLGMRIVLARENRRRSRLTDEQVELEISKYSQELIGDRHPSFRYVL